MIQFVTNLNLQFISEYFSKTGLSFSCAVHVVLAQMLDCESKTYTDFRIQKIQKIYHTKTTTRFYPSLKCDSLRMFHYRPFRLTSLIESCQKLCTVIKNRENFQVCGDYNSSKSTSSI